MRSFFLISLVLLSWTGAFAQAGEQKTATAQNILFILDASGSMWQKSDNEFRIAIARTVMKNLLGKLPANTRTGLIAYGHRQKEDCNDIETLAPLGPLDKTVLSTKLDAINPVGKTPIAKSIQHALALIRTETAPVTIILVSDGLETCEGNACDLVKQAKTQGVKITLHVVGFGIVEKDLSALECLAQAGGGQYFPANNAGELAEALDQTVVPPPAGGGYLSVKATQEGKLLDATVKVFKKGEKKHFFSARTYEGKATNPRVLNLAPGAYDVEVMSVAMDGKPTQWLKDLVVPSNDTLVHIVDFSQGVMKILVTENGILSDATVTILKMGTKERVAGGRSYTRPETNPAIYRIVPGTYDVEIASVKIEGRPVVRIEKQVLASGATLSLAHDYATGELKIGAFQGQDFVDAAITIYSKKTGKSIAGGRTYMSASSNPNTFLLEPGDYRVDLNPVKPKGLAKKSFEVTVKAKETVERITKW
jgi:Ca-activated chloride channel family protein